MTGILPYFAGIVTFASEPLYFLSTARVEYTSYTKLPLVISVAVSAVAVIDVPVVNAFCGRQAAEPSSIHPAMTAEMIFFFIETPLFYISYTTIIYYASAHCQGVCGVL